MRKKPKDADFHGWSTFEKWANANSISDTHVEDWWPWWECWKAGFNAAMNSM